MMDPALLQMPAADLIALYEEVRFQPGSPYRDQARLAIEHRAAQAESGSIDCPRLRLTYKYDRITGSVVRLEMSKAITTAVRREEHLNKERAARTAKLRATRRTGT